MSIRLMGERVEYFGIPSGGPAHLVMRLTEADGEESYWVAYTDDILEDFLDNAY